MQKQPTLKMDLVREYQENDKNDWIEYLEYHAIITKQEGNLTLIPLNYQKHILLSDFQELFAYKKLDFQWNQQLQNTEFMNKINSLQQDLKKINIKLETIELENLVFYLDQYDSPKIFTLFPQNIRPCQNSKEALSSKLQQPLTQQLNQFTQIIQSNQGKQEGRLFVIVKKALSIQKEIIEDINTSLVYTTDLVPQALMRRLAFKLHLSNQKERIPYAVQTLKKIFSLINQLNGTVFSSYVNNHLNEQPIEVLKKQLDYLKMLKKQGQITNSMKISLIQQGEILSEIQHLQEHMNETLDQATKILQSQAYQKPEILSKDILKQEMEKIESDSQFQEQQLVKQQQCEQLSEDQLSLCMSIFISEVQKEYWIFDGLIQEQQQIKSSISALLQRKLSQIIQIVEHNKDNLILLIKNIVYDLRINDEENLLEILLNLKCNEIIQFFSLKVYQNLGFEDMQDQIDQITNWYKNKKQQYYLWLLKDSPEKQNDILCQLYNKLLESVVIQLEEPAEIQIITNQTLNTLFEGKQIEQQQILMSNFKEQFTIHFGQSDEWKLFTDKLSNENFTQYTNVFCKTKTIIQTTEYKQLLSRMKSWLLQYYCLSQQLNQIFTSFREIPFDISSRIIDLKSQVLFECFLDYVFRGNKQIFNLQLHSYKIEKKISDMIIEELQRQILKKNKERDDLIISELESLNNCYIPISIIKEKLLPCTDLALFTTDKVIIQKLAKEFQEDEEIFFSAMEQYIDIDQTKIEQWRINEKPKAFTKVKNAEVSLWNSTLISSNLEKQRFTFFLQERMKVELAKTTNPIHEQFINQCNEFLIHPPQLTRFQLDRQKQLKVYINDDPFGKFTIKQYFFEQLYKFYEDQIIEHLQQQLV